MKTTEQIEQLAKKLISGNDIPAIDMKIGVKLGYAKCQEDMAQEWFLNDTPLAFGQEFAYAKGYAQCQEDMADKLKKFEKTIIDLHRKHGYFQGDNLKVLIREFESLNK